MPLRFDALILLGRRPFGVYLLEMALINGIAFTIGA